MKIKGYRNISKKVFLLYKKNHIMKRKIVDLWRLNPNWKFAAEHGQASRTGIQNPQSQANKKLSIIMCPCCLRIIHKQPVSLWQNPKQLHFLGYGFPLFFSMIQYCLISLFILILSESAMELYLSVNQECPQKPDGNINDPSRDFTYPCRSFFVRISRISPNSEQFQIDRIIRSLSFIGQAFLLVYLRDIQRKLAAYHDERNTRIKDFSIIFRNLPKIQHIQKSIKEFFNSLSINLKIQQIFLMPKIDYFHELQQEKKQIINHLKRVMKEKKPSPTFKISLEAQLQRVNLEMIETCRKTDQLLKKDELFSEKAIVILQSKEQKRSVLQKFPQTSLEQKEKYFFWMAKEVTLQSAPEPRQIIWNNINYPKYKRWLRILLGWTLSVIFLGIATGIFYFLVVFKAQSHSMALLIVTLLLIQFFNKYIMKIFLHWFSDIEMPETSSQREFSYACKYTVGMFFTTAIMSIIVEAIIYDNLQFQYGVVEGQTLMFFFNAFIVNLLWILHPQYYIHKIQRWWKFGSKNITQKEANQIMEDYPYDMGKRYAEILQTMWFTFLYTSLIPFGTFLSLIGLMIYYWVDKYNLLRRSKVQNIIESKLPLKAVKLMELTLFWKPFGELIFDIRLRETVFPQTGIMIGVSILFMLFPWNWFLDRFFFQKFNLSKQTYQQVKFRFNQTYQTVDPVQRMLALENFIETQNKARKKNLEKDSFANFQSLLEVREYEDQRKRDEEAAREMVRQEVPSQDDYSIKLKFSEKSMEPTTNNIL